MRIIETVPIADTYCSGVAKFEKTPNGNVRLWCYTVQASDCGEGPPENVLVAKIVLPLAAMTPMILAALQTLGVDLPPELAEVATAAAMPVLHH